MVDVYKSTEQIFDTRPIMYKQMFLKNRIEVVSSHLYASSGTFFAQIGQFLEAQGVFEKCFTRELYRVGHIFPPDKNR